MRKVMLLVLFPVATAALPGCQTWGPTWSELTGERWNYTEMHRRPGVIERVDDQGAFAQRPIKVEAGQHRIVLGSLAPRWRGGAQLQVVELDVKPCKRYYLNGQFENNIGPTWKPVIDYVEDISGCVAAKG